MNAPAAHASRPAESAQQATRKAAFRKRTAFGAAALAALLLAGAGSASGAALMDQIGSDGSYQQGRSHNTRQISNFYASAPQYDVAVIDDFTLTGEAVVHGVSVALFATDNDTGFSMLTGLRVNIFSHRPVPPGELYAGDVLVKTVSVADIAFTTPWTTDALSRLAVMDLTALNLHLAAGTYWLSVVALNNSFQTDSGVYTSSFAAPPDNRDNARRIGSSAVWPGGQDLALGADAAFRIDGAYVPAIPEPATFALFGAGLFALATVQLRRRQRRG